MVGGYKGRPYTPGQRHGSEKRYATQFWQKRVPHGGQMQKVGLNDGEMLKAFVDNVCDYFAFVI